MDDVRLKQTVACIADYYDSNKVGYVGHEGYRKSTDLAKFCKCIDKLIALGYIEPQHTTFLDLGCGYIEPQHTTFLDLGCADGRVNVLMSYFVKSSVGIEIDPEILAEYRQRKKELTLELQHENLLQPPDNISLFKGNSLETATYDLIENSIGVRFEKIDLFYTYITLHDLFAAKIAEEGKQKALYLVYGFNRILPRYQGLEILIPKE
jgi:SAM-dependent methyltransferase